VVAVMVGGVVALWSGCGGMPFQGSSGGGGAHAGGANQGGSTTTTDQGGGPATGGSTANGGGGATGGGGNATGGGGGPPCPDASGYYSMITEMGPGCGDLNTNAPACVMMGQEVCAYAFSSGGPGGTIPSVHGTIVIQQDGSFTGATVFEGSSPNPRTGCEGTFANGVWTIKCGGGPNMPGNDQWCWVTLTRTGNACPGMP
jgi:hypothetical protein